MCIRDSVSQDKLLEVSDENQMNFNVIDENTISVSIDEKDNHQTIKAILNVFAESSAHKDSENLINELFSQKLNNLIID